MESRLIKSDIPGTFGANQTEIPELLSEYYQSRLTFELIPFHTKRTEANERAFYSDFPVTREQIHNVALYDKSSHCCP